MLTKITLTLLLLCSLGNCYFKNQEHKDHVANILKEFMETFKSRFDTISLGEMDWHDSMELAFNYWISTIKVRDITKVNLQFNLKFTYETEWDGLVFSAPEIFVDLVIEEKYTIPIKLTNFQFTIILFTDEENLRVTGVQIDYDKVSIDVNKVVEYLSKQVLSLDLVKVAIKKAEIPIRNLCQQAIRNNWELIKPLILSLENQKVDTNYWLSLVFKLNPNIQARDNEFWLGTRGLFNLPSAKRVENNDL